MSFKKDKTPVNLITTLSCAGGIIASSMAGIMEEAVLNFFPDQPHDLENQYSMLFETISDSTSLSAFSTGDRVFLNI